MEYEFLERINSPSDLKQIKDKDIDKLCSEIRDFLIKNIEINGGHLASNLGVVETTVAMHRVFDSPKDHFIFDVGHQSYVHKILTGRRERFTSLRKFGGLSGFTKMSESEYDAFGAGHSSTSVSAALGFAESDKLKDKKDYTVCLLGDGAFTGGMVHEALNNCNPDLRLVMILNENGMSISVNKGSFASYLSKVRMSKKYMSAKKRTKSFLNKVPLLGKPVSAFLSFIKDKFKNLFLSSNYFEDLGLYYIGPIDGNNYKKIEAALRQAKEVEKSVIVHINTVKGKGYEPAEKSPDDFHSVYCGAKHDNTFHSVFGDIISDLADKDENVVGITAAMGMGTGLYKFAMRHPDRYYDVGIAEEHALTFAGGLAAAGIKPYCAIYSTFLQRGYDSIIHDICLQDLPVRIIIDRAGIAVSDGATHHGIFDVAFLSHIPNIKIYAPMSFNSLKNMLEESLVYNHPLAIRYPNSEESDNIIDEFFSQDNNSKIFKKNFNFEAECLFITYGSIVKEVSKASAMLNGEGVKTGVLLLEQLKPYELTYNSIKDFVNKASVCIFVEEGIKNGGAGMLIREEIIKDKGSAENYFIRAIDDNFVCSEAECDPYEYLGLDSKSLYEEMKIKYHNFKKRT